MSWLDQITPTNLLKEKTKFFADPQNYNPRFTYAEPIPEETLYKYGFPQKKYLDLAKAILDKTYFGRNEHELFMLEGKPVSQEEVTKKTETFLRMHGLEKKIEVVWSSSYVSRATMGHNQLKLRLPVDFRKEGLIGMLYHEIGTHALRRVNYEQQPWYQKRKEFHLKSKYQKTEEGLASLHALIPHTCKSFFISAIRYVAVEYAQNHSFVELWNLLGKYIQDPERRWAVTLRQKRGLTDTSQAGGSTKDLSYFEGSVKVWEWLEKNDFDPTPLYFGKFSYEDVSKVIALNKSFEPLLPSFFILNSEKYATEMENIGAYNLLTQI